MIFIFASLLQKQEIKGTDGFSGQRRSESWFTQVLADRTHNATAAEQRPGRHARHEASCVPATALLSAKVLSFPIANGALNAYNEV